ncbi:MAG TPA: aspartate kinase [Thermotogaceae bacterium]|nr:aspartate kinase [Thermotogota bacterium]HEW90959.1 aspartate kinase [Thermotogaceae bacterium]
MKILVQKYGGSSVKDLERIKNVAKKIKKRVDEGLKIIVVVSAMGKTTDNLLNLAESISQNPDPRELDMLLATGEQVSAALLAMALKDIGTRAISFNALQLNIRTTLEHNSAKIIDINVDTISEKFSYYDVIVITGFQGINHRGDITTLGRGGSDTSAVALAAKLKTQCEIYSDVDGVYTCDPKLHPNARKHFYITYDEILEMSASGAKVLHSRAIEIAKKYGVPIYCASSFTDEEGTRVVEKLPEWLEKPLVSGATITENQMKVTISNIPRDENLISKIFKKLSENNLNVDMISMVPSGEKAVLSFTILEAQKKDIEKILRESLGEFKDLDISYDGEYSKISVVGVGMRSSPGVAYRFFEAIARADAKPELITTSEIKISSLIPKEKSERVLKEIIKEFDL